LLQPLYYALTDSKASLSEMQDAMLDADGRYQRYLENHAKPLGALDRYDFLMVGAIAGFFTLAVFNPLRLLTLLTSLIPGMKVRLSNHLNAVSSARQDYRFGIQRTYQILPDETGERPRKTPRADMVEYRELLRLSEARPPVTFPQMRDFAQRVGLPSFVFNTTVRPPRASASAPLRDRIFEIGSVGFGSDSCGFLSWKQTEQLGWEPGMSSKGLFSDEKTSPFATIRNLNTTPAISGAALSSAGLGRRWSRWLLNVANFGLEYIVPSPANVKHTVRLSDGGHSENLGAYALLRRSCRTMLIVDAEYEPTPSYAFHAYRKLKEAALAELGIEVKVPAIEDGTFSARDPICRGSALIRGQPPSELYYLKLSMDRASLKDPTQAIESYATAHPAFPQESTVDQYFLQKRFRAYSALGYEIARRLPSNLGTSAG
jgi:hypothetical protein